MFGGDLWVIRQHGAQLRYELIFVKRGLCAPTDIKRGFNNRGVRQVGELLVYINLYCHVPCNDGRRERGALSRTLPALSRPNEKCRCERLPNRVSPELLHLQAQLAEQLPYRQAAGLQEELFDHPRVVSDPAERMVVGIDGAFVKAGHTRPGQRHQFEILTRRVEASQRGGEAFAVVRDLDPYAKRRVQAILRRCGRGQDTDLRILSDGEEGLRVVVGTWFGTKCEHRPDWFHVARIARIEKEFLYLPLWG